MKKGKKFLKFIFTFSFCFFVSCFLNNTIINAENVFTCKDRKTNENCNESTVDGYFEIDRFEVDDSSSLVNIEFPNTSIYSGKTFDIEVIKDGAIVNKSDPSLPLNVETLKLPQNLSVIKTGAFRNIASLTNDLNIPTSVIIMNDRIFADGAKIHNVNLNHFEYIISSGGGNINKRLVVSFNTFSNLDRTTFRLVSDTYNTYNVIKEILIESAPNKVIPDDFRNTTPLNYKFHKYPDNNSEYTLKSYYLNEPIDELPSVEVDNKLFLKYWYCLKAGKEMVLSVGENPHYVEFTSDYDILPKFELKDISYDVIYNETYMNPSNIDVEYDSSKDLVRLTVKINSNVEGLNLKTSWLANNQVSSDNENLTLYEHKDSSTYLASIEYSLLYNEVTYKKTLTKQVVVNIKKANLIIKTDSKIKEYGTYLTDEEITYSKKGLKGEDNILPEDVYFTYDNNSDIGIGNHNDAIITGIKKINNGLDNVIDNYNIINMPGDLIVTKKTLDPIEFNSTFRTYYGEEKKIATVISDTVYDGKYSHNIKVIFSRNIGNDVGEYLVNGIESIDNENYLIYLNHSSRAKLKIEPKPVDLTFEYLDSDFYTGKSKNVSLYYTDIMNNKVFVEPKYIFENRSVNEAIDAGIYTISVDTLLDSNYQINPEQEPLSFEISKAVAKPSYDTYQEFVYTAKKIIPVIHINNDEQEPIYIFYNASHNIIDECVDAGDYTVNVIYNETKNYKAFYTSSLRPIAMHIDKYIINLNPREFTSYYGEKLNINETIEFNGEKLNIKYLADADATSQVGSYTIIDTIVYLENGMESNNYKGFISKAQCKDKVKILPRPVSINYYDYTDLVYDGNIKDIGAYIIDDLSGEVIRGVDVKVKAYEGEIKNAGDYHLNASIDDSRYSISNKTIKLISIEKGTYDISNIKFISRKFTFNFSKHSIEIEGELPQGVSVNYTIDGKKGNSSSGFEHEVVASFVVDENNYNSLNPIKAIIKVDMTWLFSLIICLVIAIGAAICGVLLYNSYRREHPRKIKLKIKNVVNEDLAAKRVATSVKEVLGDPEEKEENKELLEDEDDLVTDKNSSDSFIERIYAADSELKYYYSEVKNEILSYEGITHTVDRKYEVFYHGTRMIAKMSICNNILRLYVNLDPDMYDKNEYNHRDMSKFECHAKTPLRINVNSLESLRHAKVFIRIVRKHERLESVSGFARVDYEKFYTLKEKFFPSLVNGMFKKNKKKKSAHKK